MLYYKNKMGGGLMQLVAYGAQDIYLTGNPQITFFKVVYRRHTNFSMECIRQTFKGTVAANSRVVATISRNGDLVHDCFIKVPSYTSSKTDDNPGHNMIDNIELEIGGQLIDKHYGHWMEAHAELTEVGDAPILAQFIDFGDQAGQDDTLEAGVAASSFQLTAFAGGVVNISSQGRPDHYVPLRFWFCRHVGLSLPLIALQYHEVNINIKFAAGGCFGGGASGDNPSLWCNYIYLDTDERRRFAQVSHEYLIEQVQVNNFSMVRNQSNTLKLNFNHPVKELIWGVTGTGTAAWGQNENTSGQFYSLQEGDSAGDNKWQLKLNGHDRFEKQSISYFTRYQPMKYHTSHSKGSEYDTLAVYSFALKPEEHQPSGTCNFSRIDNAQLICDNFGTAAADMTNLYVYAVNYNVLRIMSGMGGLAYSN